MEIVFLKSFLNDLKKIKDQKLKQKVKDLIMNFEEVESLDQVPNVTKLSGYSIAYGVRVGNYRLGFYFENGTVEMAGFVKRNDIYKVFPD